MFYKADLIYIFQDTLKGHKELPSWRTTACTQLLPKNENTYTAKNYRPIAQFTPVVLILLYNNIVKLIILLPLNKQEASLEQSFEDV